MNPVELAYQMGYRCDKCGNVTGLKGQVLKIRPNCKGYPYFGIRLFGRKKKNVATHRLQAFQKFGAAMFAPGMEVRHMDSNRMNAHWDNLELGTRRENEMDKPPEVRLASAIAATRAAQKHDHAAIIQHYREHGFRLTLNTFQIGKGTLSFILNKSMAVKELEKFPRSYLETSVKGK